MSLIPHIQLTKVNAPPTNKNIMAERGNIKQTKLSKSIIIFEDVPVRRVWVASEEKWYFAIIDVVEVLTGSPRPRKYWNALKTKLKAEGNELSPNVGQLKLTAKDGKKYNTDVADTETIFRIIQSIPSPKAEPFKQWLAKVGYERLQETIEPERAINRARRSWQAMGASDKWIEQRMRGQEIRNNLTDYWQDSGVKEDKEYAKLTNIIHREWSGLNIGEHKKLKKIGRRNLRDNMTAAELLFTALAELSTTQIAKKDKSKGYNENKISAVRGGRISRSAREQLEQATGERVVSPDNFLPPPQEVKKIKN